MIVGYCVDAGLVSSVPSLARSVLLHEPNAAGAPLNRERRQRSCERRNVAPENTSFLKTAPQSEGAARGRCRLPPESRQHEGTTGWCACWTVRRRDQALF